MAILCGLAKAGPGGLQGNFEGTGPTVYFGVVCGQTTNLQSLPPGYTTLEIENLTAGCEVDVFCVGQFGGRVVNAAGGPYVEDGFCDAGYEVSGYNAFCNC